MHPPPQDILRPFAYLPKVLACPLRQALELVAHDESLGQLLVHKVHLEDLTQALLRQHLHAQAGQLERDIRGLRLHKSQKKERSKKASTCNSCAAVGRSDVAAVTVVAEVCG